MPAGSEVRLRVRKGSKYSSNPVLLVNMPENLDDGEKVPKAQDGEEETKGDAELQDGISRLVSANTENTDSLKYTMT